MKAPDWSINDQRLVVKIEIDGFGTPRRRIALHRETRMRRPKQTCVIAARRIARDALLLRAARECKKKVGEDTTKYKRMENAVAGEDDRVARATTVDEAEHTIYRSVLSIIRVYSCSPRINLVHPRRASYPPPLCIAVYRRRIPDSPCCPLHAPLFASIKFSCSSRGGFELTINFVCAGASLPLKTVPINGRSASRMSQIDGI